MFFDPMTVYKNSKNNKTSQRVEEVLCDTDHEITLFSNVVNKHTNPKKGRDMNFVFFPDLELVPLQETSSCDLYELRTRTKKITYNKWLKDLEEALYKGLINNWDNSKLNIFFHSSGYDSRILNTLISRARKENGDDWLGEVLFVCVGTEGTVMKEIMRYTGWDESQYHVFDENFKEDYYQYNYDIKNVWKMVNGACLRPFNLLRYLKERIKSYVKTDKEIQIWSGMFSNEWMDCVVPMSRYKKVHPLNYFTKRWKKSRFLQDLGGIDIQFPMLSKEVMTFFIEHDVQYPNEYIRKNHSRQDLLASMNPKLQKYLPNTGDSSKNRIIPRSVMKNVKKSYKKSWYGRKLRPYTLKMIDKDASKAQWWSHYTVASFTEYLHNKGCNIVTTSVERI